VLGTLIAGLVAARLWLVFHRLYDPDELEHLHAGFCVWQGLVPYRDFFEQHGPVLWYLAQPLFAVWDASLTVLFAGRVIIWLLGVATIALTTHAGRRLYGRWAGAVAGLLLVTLPAFQEKNVEWRPDNVAVPLVLLAILAAGRATGPSGSLWAGLTGAALSAAFVCTQKVAYLGLGLVVGWLWVLRADATAGWWRLLAVFAAGALVVAGTVLLFFAAQGAAFEYVTMTLLLPLRWKTREPAVRYLAITLAAAPVFWAACAAGLVQALTCLGQRGRSSSLDRMIACGAAAHLVGLLVVPAAFHQYYLPLAPLAALLGARAIVAVAAPGREVGRDPPAKLIRCASVSVAAVVWLFAVACRTGPAWLRMVPGTRAGPVFEEVLNELAAFLGTPAGLASTAALLASAVVAVGLYCGGARRVAALLWLAAALAGAAPFLALQFRWSHREQTHTIERLMRATEPDDRFLDGYTGYGALRPHAFFYFWINHHSWPLVPPEARVAGLLRVLDDPRTRVLLLDRYLRDNLPDEVQRFIVRRFHPDPRYSAPGCVVLVKTGRELPDVDQRRHSEQLGLR
jgi:hypothetical protein